MQSENIISSEEPRRTSQEKRISRQVEASNLENDKYMFENQVACDVTLTALSLDGSSTSVPAHKYVLIARNSVFRAMFCGPLADHSTTIHVPDISSEALVELLRYLYYGCVTLDGDIVLELLYASCKYLMPSLSARCCEYLAQNIDSDNACVILEYALLYDEADLTKKCLRYIQRYTAQILNTDSFVEVQKNTLESILNLDSLSVSEDVLVGGLLRWAQSRINLSMDEEEGEEGQGKNEGLKKNVFDGILSKIRVNSVSEETIQDLLDSQDDLAAQLGSMVRVLKRTIPETLGQNENSESESVGVKPRLELPSGHVTCDVIATSSSSLVYNGRACAPLEVETSEPITIHKIHLLARAHSNSPLVVVSISQNDASLVSYEFNCAMYRKTSDVLGPLFSLPLPHPVQVEEGGFKIEVRYRISQGSYGSVQVGVPRGSRQKFGGLLFGFPDTFRATPVASFEASVA